MNMECAKRMTLAVSALALGTLLADGRLLTFKAGVSGESLTLAQNGNGVHYWTSPTNWTDEAGNMALPMQGDRLFLDVRPSNRSACRFDDYNSSVFDAWGGNRQIPYMRRIEFGPNSGGHNVSDCGFRLMSVDQGGEGLITRGSGSNSFWLSLIAPGDVICDIGNQSSGSVSFSGAKGVGSTQKLGVIKRGAANLTIGNDGGTNMRAFIVEEGTLTSSYATNGIPANMELCVTGTASTAWLKFVNPQKANGAWLHSPDNLPTTGHGITSANAISFELCGESPVDEQYFAGRIDGKLTLVWNPSDSTKIFRLARAESTTTGSLIVSNGVMRLTDGATSASLASVEVDGANSSFAIASGSGANFHAARLLLTNGGKMYLAAGVLATVDSAMVAGDAVVRGRFYSGDGSIGEQADWLSGSGCVYVIGDAGAPSSAVWTGDGADELLATAANWDGGEAPDLASRGLTATFAAGGASAHLATIFTEGFNGIVLSAPPGATGFSFTAGENARTMFGAGGLTTVCPEDRSARTYTMGWPITLMDAQSWTLAGTNDTLDVTAPISSLTGGTLVKTGPGRLNLRTANTFSCPMTVDEGEVDVYDGNAFGSAAAATDLNLSKSKVVFHGVTCPEPFTAQTLASSKFACAPGTTNIFTGPVDLRVGSTSVFLGIDSNSAMIFRGGFWNGGNFGHSGGGTMIVEEKPMMLTDRVSMNGDSVMDLRVSWNQTGINHYLFYNSRLYTRAPYAIAYGLGEVYNACAVMGSGSGKSLWDMCGNDQAIMELCGYNYNGDAGAEVTSADPAVLHWKFTGHRSGDGRTERFFSVTNYVKFTGAAMISYEGNRELCLMRDQASTGTLAVASGTLRFLPEGGSWLGATNVVVTGGTLSLLKNGVFDASVGLDVSGTGKLELGDGVALRCGALTIDGRSVANGIYGSSSSGAARKDDVHFAGAGVLKIGNIGTTILFR